MPINGEARWGNLVLILLFAHDAQQIQKHIHKIQIQREGAHNGFFVIFFGTGIADDVGVLNFLCVVGC